MIRAVQLYTFLEYCNNSPLEKEILECGAGISPSLEPLLVRFFEAGYRTHGTEISEKRWAAAQAFCEEKGIGLDIRQGDMCHLPFEDERMSFVFSYNSIFHMTKHDIGVAMEEIERVLRSGGLCFVNFLSVDDGRYGDGKEMGKGEFAQAEAGRDTIHTYYEDDEADAHFVNFEVLLKEKRILERTIDGSKYVGAYIDYIAEKKA
jgi:ubiquinone/menaquinone biosynthesis C-methylase UbiE